MTDAPPHVTLSIPGFPRPGFRVGPTAKIGLIGCLLILMLLPLELVRGVIADRQQYQEEALTGLRAAWGPAQSVLGPVLVVPYSGAAA